MQLLAFQAVMTLDGFDFCKHVFRGRKIRVLGVWGVGGWSRGGPLKSSGMGSVKDLSAPTLGQQCLELSGDGGGRRELL